MKLKGDTQLCVVFLAEMRSVALPLDLALRLTTEERVKEIWVSSH